MTGPAVKMHTASTYPLDRGGYRITCNVCPFRLDAVVTRNRAYLLASKHAAEPHLPAHDLLVAVL